MQTLYIFDSGIGGFSLLRQLVMTNTSLAIHYLADQAYFPYGDKTTSWLQARLKRIACYCRDQNPGLFVIACNTGTVASIEIIRSILACPVVGIEPVIKPLSMYKHPLILTTPTTANSHRTQSLRKRYGSHIHIHGCPGLAQAIESNNINQVKAILHEIVKITEREKTDAIGLSCTHYPLIIDQLSTAMPKIKFYDPTQAILRQVKRYLSVASTTRPTLHFATTGSVVRFREQVNSYFGATWPVEGVVV